MFNTTNIRQSPSRVVVEERRAPTDESVRLLSEMQEKVLASVIDTFEFGDNELIRGRVDVLNLPWESNNMLVCSFQLNGVKCEVREKIYCDEVQKDRIAAYRSLARLISNKIFETLVAEKLAGGIMKAGG